MKMKKLLVVLFAAALLFSLVACGSDDAPKDPITGGETTLVIYDGLFSEMQIIHYMAKLLVEEHTGATVEIRDAMAPPNCYSELVKGNCDIMNSYDGTLLTTFLHLDPSDVPEYKTIYDYANEQAQVQNQNVHLLDKLGLNNTYAIGVPQSIADQYQLEAISDLAAVADQLVFGAEHDFFTEEGSAKYNPFIQFYGLSFKEAKQLDMTLKYAAVENGSIDVTIVYATDGLNRKSQLKVLADDRNFFPEYNGALLVRDDIFERFEGVAPNLEEVLNMLGGIFTDEAMVELTYAVDVGDENGVTKTVEQVSEEYLRNLGLIK